MNSNHFSVYFIFFIMGSVNSSGHSLLNWCSRPDISVLLVMSSIRLNGEVRDREKVMRGLKKSDTTILTGYQLFHNYETT